MFLSASRRSVVNNRVCINYHFMHVEYVVSYRGILDILPLELRICLDTLNFHYLYQLIQERSICIRTVFLESLQNSFY